MIERVGDRIILVGTAHVLPDSVREVGEVIRKEKPDLVALELCRKRFESLINEDSLYKIPLTEMIRGDRLKVVLANLLLSYIQRRIGREFETRPGEEMLEGYRAAREIGAEVALIDRDITITLSRLLSSLSLREKFRILYEGLTMFLESLDSEELRKEIEELREEDIVRELLDEVKRLSPNLYRVLIEERDAYMAWRLLELSRDYDKIVAVIGAGHIDGVKRYLEDPSSLPPLDDLVRIERRRFSPIKVIGYALPIIVISLFLAGLLRGVSIGDELLRYILLTGGLSALGTLLAGGHILSALTAFLAAPITVLHPMLAAGWFAGLVEMKQRRLSLQDIGDLFRVESLREMLSNKFFRVLLVVIGANIGASIGFYLTVPTVLKSLWIKVLGGRA